MSLGWSDRYLTGHHVVDQQHRLLFSLVDELGRAVQAGDFDSAPTLQLLQRIEDYMRIHFHCEEACMRAGNCPYAEANALEHRALEAYVVHFLSDWQAQGPTLEALHRLHRHLHDWLVRHVLGVDQALRLVEPTQP